MKNSLFKVFLKKYIKYISNLYYEFAPKKVKKNIHKFITSEALKKSYNNNLFTSVFFELRTSVMEHVHFVLPQFKMIPEPTFQ